MFCSEMKYTGRAETRPFKSRVTRVHANQERRRTYLNTEFFIFSTSGVLNVAAE